MSYLFKVFLFSVLWIWFCLLFPLIFSLTVVVLFFWMCNVYTGKQKVMYSPVYSVDTIFVKNQG